MRPINYWITFTARDDKYREVLAVRMVFSLSDDYRSTRAEIPAFGIVAEGEQAQGKALERLYVVLARSHNGQLRQGLQAHRHKARFRRSCLPFQAREGHARRSGLQGCQDMRLWRS